MGHKKAREKSGRQRHKESLRLAKEGHRGQPSLMRGEPFRDTKPAILIVCEGENTEPSYFSRFRLSSARIYPVGEGYNTVSNQAFEYWLILHFEDHQGGGFHRNRYAEKLNE